MTSRWQTAIISLITQWSYCSLALTHRSYPTSNILKPKVNDVRIIYSNSPHSTFSRGFMPLIEHKSMRKRSKIFPRSNVCNRLKHVLEILLWFNLKTESDVKPHNPAICDVGNWWLLRALTNLRMRARSYVDLDGKYSKSYKCHLIH